jgi:hypothetical protein
MSNLTRRSLFQGTATTLTTIALSPLLTQATALLAQSAKRKLALLIGIDAYEDGKALDGCNTDVDLQRELLIHRYGFNPIDIVELRDRNATYQNIIDEFQKLIQKANPDDLIVFHFSGHGSRVLDSNPIADFIITDPSTDKPVGLNGTIVPFDWKTSNPREVRQIMGKTLYLLTTQLKTDRIVTILDCCHSEGGLRGNSNVRSIDSRMNSGSAFPTVVKEELELQKRLLPTNWTEETLQKKRSEGIAKGLSLGAASFDRVADVVNPIALDLSSGDFRAGAFTYLLTRYLWQSPTARSIDTAFAQLSLSSTLLSSTPDQSPVYRLQPNQNPKQTLLYLEPPIAVQAEGVIHSAPRGQQIEFWLGGASPASLKAYDQAVFQVIDRTGKVVGELQQISRAGLIGYGKFTKAPPVKSPIGLLLREKIRGVPDNLTLKVGLDSSLGTDRDRLTTLIASLNQIEVVPIAPGKEVNYILARTSPLRASEAIVLSPTGNLSLLTHNLGWVSSLVGDAKQSEEETIRRRLKALLAGQLFRIMMGETSPLKISLRFQPVNQSKQPIGTPQTLSYTAPMPITLDRGSKTQLALINQETEPLYMAVLVISSNGEISTAYPYMNEAAIDEALVIANQAKILPYEFNIRKTPGQFELMLIASRKPLDRFLKAVETIVRSRGDIQRGTPITLRGSEPLDLMTDLLEDVDRISRDVRIYTGKRVIDRRQVCALSTIVRVV